MNILKGKKTFIIILLLFIIAVFTFLYIRGFICTSFNIEKEVYLYIDKNKEYDSILTQLDTTAHVQSVYKFNKLASILKYPANIKPGRYKITPDMNIFELINNLKKGKQSAVKLSFNNIRLKTDLAKRLSAQLELSDIEINEALNNSTFCSKYGFDSENIISMFIPNTYEVYWNISLVDLFTKMQKEYNKFWNADRLKKAKELKLTPIQVSILASIVEEECFYEDEYTTVAGLYLNRLQANQLLQADPTVKYAANDFSLRRILHKHLSIDSPYNTYKYQGLPPGPIRIASIKGIDAVLNPAVHNYYYMCAKEDLSRRHNFAKTFTEHEQNASRYRKALNKRQIFN